MSATVRYGVYVGSYPGDGERLHQEGLVGALTVDRWGDALRLGRWTRRALRRKRVLVVRLRPDVVGERWWMFAGSCDAP